MTGWVARFGVPLQMTSDRGRQFISSLWSEMARSLGTQLHRTTSFHPQANGMVERFHRSLKASLRARLHDGNWIDELPWVLLGLRTATKEDLQTSPAEMVFGDSPLLPGELHPHSSYPLLRPAPLPHNITGLTHLRPAQHWLAVNMCLYV